MKNSEEKIRKLHYSKWSIERKEFLQTSFEGSESIGGGVIGSILIGLGYLAVGMLYLVGYMVYIGLYALGAIIAAYLIVSGIILLATAGLVGMICFLPFIILLPFFG